jgi:osmotically-inducible protein OsmY
VVASAAEFARAREDAQVAGVEIVDASPLHVERWTRDKELRRGKYAPADAAELQRAAQQALGRQPRLANFAVTVEIRGHVAILRGTVGNLYARRQAERTLRTVVGIGAITNRLKVRPAEAAEDPVIAADLRLALRRDPHLADLPLQVAASGGVARLAGTVDTYFQKARAEDLASMARGIYAVSNQVEVRQDAAAFITSPYVDEGDGRDYAWYQPQPRRIVRDDETVRAAIAEHLRWSPYINADAVQVAMHAGVATLTGSVACDTQKRAAEHSAYGGGAAWVVNELKVEHELVKSAKE